MEFQSPSERAWEWVRERQFEHSLRRLGRSLCLAHASHWIILAALIALLASSSLPIWVNTADSNVAPISHAGSMLARITYLADFAREFVTTLGFMALLYMVFSPVHLRFRKFILWAALPIVVSFLLVVTLAIIALNIQETSVMTPRFFSGSELKLPGEIGAGAILAGIALFALGAILWRTDDGRLTLPIRFASAPKTENTKGRPLAFILLILAFGFGATLFRTVLNGTVAYFLVGNVDLQEGKIPSVLIFIGFLSSVVSTLPVTMAALRLWGEQWKDRLRACLRFVSLREYVIAIAAPLSIYLAVRIMEYVYLHVLLNMADDHLTPRPEVFEIFALPSWRGIAFIFLSFVLPAFLEEIGWRGYLQSFAVRRFGIAPGILLVGVTWATWHIRQDVVGSTSLTHALTLVFVRLIGTTLIGALMGWLYLRTGSIVPVTLWHAVHNTLTSVDPIKNSSAAFSFAVRSVVSLALVFFLFTSYPPVENENEEEKGTSLD